MPAFYLDHPSGQLVHTRGRPFASGGEGELYHIESPAAFVNLVVKIYRPEKRTPERQARLQYLLAHPPQRASEEKHQALTWIRHLVFEPGSGFAGFAMPFAEGIKLEMLCANRLPKNLGAVWQRFDFAHSDALRLRLKLCYNIATALYQVHQTGCYVLVDMKPENIMVQSNGLVSIIDIDSIQVQQGHEVLFAATVATPEFTPPEYYRGIEPGQTPISQSWDCFSMAVIFYKLLLGLHPFAGNNHKPPYNIYQSLEEMIEQGLFPFGSKAEFMGVIPPLHQRFGKLDEELQMLFWCCFEQGHQQPELRPTANEWCRELAMVWPFLTYRPLPSEVLQLPEATFFTGAFAVPSLEELLQPVPECPSLPEEEAGKNFIWSVLFFLFALTPGLLTLVSILSELGYANMTTVLISIFIAMFVQQSFKGFLRYQQKKTNGLLGLPAGLEKQQQKILTQWGNIQEKINHHKEKLIQLYQQYIEKNALQSHLLAQQEAQKQLLNIKKDFTQTLEKADKAFWQLIEQEQQQITTQKMLFREHFALAAQQKADYAGKELEKKRQQIQAQIQLIRQQYAQQYEQLMAELQEARKKILAQCTSIKAQTPQTPAGKNMDAVIIAHTHFMKTAEELLHEIEVYTKTEVSHYQKAYKYLQQEINKHHRAFLEKKVSVFEKILRIIRS